MKTFEIFLSSCNEIAKPFLEYGFKPLQKGQLLKKISQDKDMYYEIHFQTSYTNNSEKIEIIPHLQIFSKELKKWEIEITKNIKSRGLIYVGQFGYISQYNYWKVWNVAGVDFYKSITEITEIIKSYVIPIIDIFESKIKAVEYLKLNGTKFNQWARKSLHPMAFMIYFGGKEPAEMFLKDFIESCTYKNRIYKLYEELNKIKNKSEIDLNTSEFNGSIQIKLAFVNGIKI
jgi:hypothetical protein